jgi:hypothetical protein
MKLLTKSIEVPIYFTPEGSPTCRTTNGMCLFYRTGKFGLIEYCSLDEHALLDRRDNTQGVPNLGYTIPVKSCKLHNMTGDSTGAI